MATKCAISRDEFNKKASSISIKLVIDGEEFELTPKLDRDSGESLGWGINLRSDDAVSLNGIALPCMVNANVTLIGSKKV